MPQSKKKPKSNKVQGALKRIFLTPDGEILKGYMTGVIVTGSYTPGRSHDEMIHIEGQRMAFRQLLNLAGEGVVSADTVMTKIAEGADNE